jgi:hypothetical protein
MGGGMIDASVGLGSARDGCDHSEQFGIPERTFNLNLRNVCTRCTVCEWVNCTALSNGSTCRPNVSSHV